MSGIRQAFIVKIIASLLSVHLNYSIYGADKKANPGSGREFHKTIQYRFNQEKIFFVVPVTAFTVNARNPFWLAVYARTTE